MGAPKLTPAEALIAERLRVLVLALNKDTVALGHIRSLAAIVADHAERERPGFDRASFAKRVGLPKL